MTRPVLEVCASSPEDVRVAAEAGADRVELCLHWECGGLTPPEADVRAAVAVGIPVHVLVRPRAGHFCYAPAEWEAMRAQALGALAAGARRVVIGGLDAAGGPDLAAMAALAAAFGPDRWVWHRALDAAADVHAAWTAAATLPSRRLLSSGGAPDAWSGRPGIAALVAAGWDVVVGSGVRPEHVPHWASAGVEAVHASCRRRIPSTLRGFDGTTHPVDPEQVAAFRRALDQLPTPSNPS
jgi:copper homeostasis protein